MLSGKAGSSMVTYTTRRASIGHQVATVLSMILNWHPAPEVYSCGARSPNPDIQLP